MKNLCIELEQTWHEEIPISKAMGIRVADFANDQLVVRAELEPNINVHGTAFAGSLYAIAALCGWGMTWLQLRSRRIDGSIVIADGTYSLRPPGEGADRRNVPLHRRRSGRRARKTRRGRQNALHPRLRHSRKRQRRGALHRRLRRARERACPARLTWSASFTRRPVDGIIDARLGIDRSNWDHPPHLALSQLRMDRMMPVVHLEPAHPIALPRAPRTLDIDALTFDDPWTGSAIDGATFLNRRLFNDALLVMHRGRVVHESYRNGMTAADHHVQHSTTKSLTTMLLAQAIDAGRMDPAAPFDRYLPELEAVDGWHGVTLQHVLDMATGVKYVESYDDRNSDYHSYARAVGYYPAPANESIGARRWLIEHMTRRVAAPGTRFNYASPLTNALMMAAEHALRSTDSGTARTAPVPTHRRRIGRLVQHRRCRFSDRRGPAQPDAADFARWASVMINGGRNLAGERDRPGSRSSPTPARRTRRHTRRSMPSNVPHGFRADTIAISSGSRSRNCASSRCSASTASSRGSICASELMIIGYGSFPVADVAAADARATGAVAAHRRAAVL